MKSDRDLSPRSELDRTKNPLSGCEEGFPDIERTSRTSDIEGQSIKFGVFIFVCLTFVLRRAKL